MALFSRRILQRALDESESYLNHKQRENTCNLLNTVRPDYLAIEWEQIILNAASKIGRIQHEPAFGGLTKPDLLLEVPGLRFIADVTAVSDRGFQKSNPTDALDEEFRRQLRKHKLSGGGFDIQIDAHPRSVYRDSPDKPGLKLPKISAFHTKIFTADFRRFLENVRKNPEQSHHLDAVHSDTGVHFSYHPARRGTNSSSHLSFDFANVIDQNPVYNALRAKADQLRNTKFIGVKGIFLCDGNCRMLGSTSANWAAYQCQEVIWHFLKQHQSIAFVVTVVVREVAIGGTFHNIQRYIEPKLYLNPQWQSQQSALQKTLLELLTHLPPLEQSPVNALNELKGRKEPWGRYQGRLTVSDGITMSARMLLEILSGERTIEDFENEYRMRREENPFRRKLFEGRLITEVNIERLPIHDDDRVTIRFGKIDPAIHVFQLKK